MGWRFRKSFKILPGVRMNVGKRGVSSFTFGPRGASINKGKNGTHANFSLKGTGLSYRTKITGGKIAQQKQQQKGCLPIVLVSVFLLIMLKSCFSSSDANRNDVPQPVTPSAQKIEQKNTDDFKPIPYLQEQKPVQTPSVTEFEKEVARKHQESEAKVQHKAEDTKERIRQWRENDEQTRKLLSNVQGGSSNSYYSPPSGYTYQERTYESSRDKNVSVQGYYRKDGTYVESYKRSSPNR